MPSRGEEVLTHPIQRKDKMKAIEFYNANATNVVHVPRPDHPADQSGVAGVRKCTEAQFFAKDALVMSLAEACDFAEAFVNFAAERRDHAEG